MDTPDCSYRNAAEHMTGWDLLLVRRNSPPQLVTPVANQDDVCERRGNGVWNGLHQEEALTVRCDVALSVRRFGVGSERSGVEIGLGSLPAFEERDDLLAGHLA